MQSAWAGSPGSGWNEVHRLAHRDLSRGGGDCRGHLLFGGFAMTRGWPYMIAAGVTALLVIGMLFYAHYAKAQEHHTHEGAVGKFYQSWKMPDNRAASCCNDEDCTPAASRLVNGKWEAQRDGEWVSIPEHKIETERDSPDGRSHLCGKRYNVFGKGGVTVFCFIAGSGT